FSPVSIARLRALARIFARGLADVLARPCRLPLRGCSFGDTHLFSYALANQSRPNAAEDRVKVERSSRRLLNALARNAALSPDICAFGAQLWRRPAAAGRSTVCDLKRAD